MTKIIVAIDLEEYEGETLPDKLYDLFQTAQDSGDWDNWIKAHIDEIGIVSA